MKSIHALILATAAFLSSCATETTAPASNAQKQPQAVRVNLETSMGNIVVEMDAEKAPITVKNFLGYVDKGFYDGTIIHRVVRGFVIQGGGLTPDMSEKQAGPVIKNEAANGLRNDRGTVAMAREPEPDSATAQFYFNLVNNDKLNHRDDTQKGFGYCVFGRIVEGLDVMDKIAAVAVKNVKVGQEDYENVPVSTILIQSIKRIP